jgi:DNA ligase 1
MRLAELVATSRAVADTPKRTFKIERLAACIASMAPDERAIGASYLAGELPQGKIGLGYAQVYGHADDGEVPEIATAPITDEDIPGAASVVNAALASPAAAGEADAASTASTASTTAAASHERIEATAATAAHDVLGDGLQLLEVDRMVTELAQMKGSGVKARREAALGALMSRSTAAERRFLRALFVGELRQGALDGIVVEAIAAAARIDPALVRRAHMLSGNLGQVAATALSAGTSGLEAISISLFRPLLPMLAQTAGDAGEALEQLGEAAFEHKLDGARVQLHKDGDDVRVYTRGLKEVTGNVPELIELVRALPLARCILDGEAIARDRSGRPLPFQTTMRRFGRPTSNDQLRAELPLSLSLFDALWCEGESLLDAPWRRRRAVLDEYAPKLAVPHLVTSDPAAAAGFYAAAINAGHEGVMAKALGGGYEAGLRGAGWLKIKKVDRLDLVILAAEWGSGRRRGWLSNLHLGARDPERGGFVMLGKTFKGMTDEILAWQTKELLARELAREGHIVHVRPELVAEIAFNDVQRSPQYPGGLALRFARVVRYREDKPADQADTIEAVRAVARRDGVIDREESGEQMGDG